MLAPLALLAVSFSLGIIAARHLGMGSLLLWVLALTSFWLGSAFGCRQKRTPFCRNRPTIFLLLLTAALGSVRLFAFDLFSAGNLALWANGNEVEVTFTVLSAQQKETRVVYRGRVRTLKSGSEQHRAWGLLEFTLPSRLPGSVPGEAGSPDPGLAKGRSRSALPGYTYGDLLQLRGRLRSPAGPRNPGDFDYRDYLRRLGIHMVMEVGADDVTRIGQGWGHPLIAQALSFRQRLVGVMTASLPPIQAALLAGIGLGGNEGLPPEVEEAFRRTGSYHILAVSGSNVAFVVGVILALLHRLHVGRKTATALALPAVVAYVFITGAGPSVSRAGIMAVLSLLGLLLVRHYDVYSSLAAAALLILGYNPYDLFDIGFQLSFAATIGIVSVESGSSNPGEGLHRQSLRWLLPSWLFETLSVTVSAQLAVAPLSLYYFQRLSLIALVANLVIVPLAGGLVVMAFVLGLGGLLLPPVALIINQLAYFPLELLLRVVAWMASLPGAEVSFALPWWGVGLYYLALALVVVRRGRAGVPDVALPPLAATLEQTAYTAAARSTLPTGTVGSRRQRRLIWELVPQCLRPWFPQLTQPGRPTFSRLGFILILILLLLNLGFWSWLFWPWRGPVLQVTVLDVGQGDAIFVRFPQGQTMLIDAGGWSEAYPKDFDPGRQIILPFFRRQGIKRLDFLVLSHPHQDHSGGMPAILEEMEVGAFYQAPEEVAAWLAEPFSSDQALVLARQSYEKIHRLSQERGIPLYIWQRGDKLAVSPEVTIHVLHPGKLITGTHSDVNNNSLVLKLVYKKVAFLFTGDLEKEGEADILAHLEGLKSEFLKVGHHGSRTSSQPEFLRAVRPQVAIISVGRNFYGHPHPLTLNNLKEVGARLYRTDQDGAVTVTTDGQRWAVQTVKR